MEDGRKMICDRCRAAVPISQIQYLPRGKDGMTALCETCRKEAPTAPAGAQGAVAGNTTKTTAAKSKVPDKESFFCARCKYKFKFDVFGATNLKCPYCGKEDKVISGTVKSAEALLNSSELDRF